MKRGSESPNAKLTEIEVRMIRQRIQAGESLSSLADDYGVSVAQISYIKTRKQWKHVD